MRPGVDGGDAGAGHELDGALGVERLGAEEDPVEPGAPGEIVLRERGALVRRLALRRHEEELPVEPLAAKAVHGLAARLSAAHHDDPRYLSHAPSHSPFRLAHALVHESQPFRRAGRER